MKQNIILFERDKYNIIAFLTVFEELIVKLAPFDIELAGFYELTMESGPNARVFSER